MTAQVAYVPKVRGELSRGDKTWVIYRGPDRSRFFLAGMRGQGKQGVEWARGVVGLDRPPTELVWLQEAHQNGADLVGSNTDVRTLSFAVNIYGKNPRQFRAFYDNWKRANRFDQYGRLYFVNSYSGVRFSDVLLGEAPSGSIEMDPAIRRGLAGYPYKWVAPNPYYKGYTETFEFPVMPPNTSGISTMNVRVRNLGDSYTYPIIGLPGPGTWTIPLGTRFPDQWGHENVGPFDGQVIELPPLKTGQAMWLNTDPRIETIDMVTAEGKKTNLWAQMGGKRPRFRFPGNTSELWPLSVKNGTVGALGKIVIQPLYTTFC